MKKITRIFIIVLVPALVFLCSFPLIISAIIGINPSVITITSSSMAPALNIGDLVFVEPKPAEDISASEEDGDIVVIKSPKYFFENGFPSNLFQVDNNTPIVHRAIGKHYDSTSGQYFFITKGDANPFVDWCFFVTNDSLPDFLSIEYNTTKVIAVPETEILGVITLSVPFIGYLNIFSIPIFIILSCLMAFCAFLEISKREIIIRKRG